MGCARRPVLATSSLLHRHANRGLLRVVVEAVSETTALQYGEGYVLVRITDEPPDLNFLQRGKAMIFCMLLADEIWQSARRNDTIDIANVGTVFAGRPS